MKRIITAIILLSASVIVTNLALILTGNIDREINDSAKRLEYALDTKAEAVPQLYTELAEDWDKFYKVCSVYISHQHLENTENLISGLEKYIEQREYRTAAVICSQIGKEIHHLYQSELPVIQNIF